MMVTSNHLEIEQNHDAYDGGDELTKRPDNFGLPVGKGACGPLVRSLWCIC